MSKFVQNDVCATHITSHLDLIHALFTATFSFTLHLSLRYWISWIGALIVQCTSAQCSISTFYTTEVILWFFLTGTCQHRFYGHASRFCVGKRSNCLLLLKKTRDLLLLPLLVVVNCPYFVVYLQIGDPEALFSFLRLILRMSHPKLAFDMKNSSGEKNTAKSLTEVDIQGYEREKSRLLTAKFVSLANVKWHTKTL